MITERRMRLKEVEEIKSKMEAQFGSSISGNMFINSDNKVYLVSAAAAEFSIKEFNVEGLGLYIGRIEPDGFRLSIEGAQMINAKKNVLEIPNEMIYDWVRGFNLKITNEFKSYVIIKNGKDILGCGKSNGEVVLNYVSKPRRIITFRKDADTPVDKVKQYE